MREIRETESRVELGEGRQGPERGNKEINGVSKGV